MTELSWLERSIHWRETGDVFVPHAARYDGHALELRLGDFPAEPLYTLLVDGVEVVSFSEWPGGWVRTVVLREERSGGDLRSLWAYVDKNGDFVIDGQDLGPAVERAFGEGIREYEWIRTVPASEVSRLVVALGANAGTDVLDALRAWQTTHQPDQLERLIEDQNLDSTFWSRCGD